MQSEKSIKRVLDSYRLSTSVVPAGQTSPQEKAFANGVIYALAWVVDWMPHPNTMDAAEAWYIGMVRAGLSDISNFKPLASGLPSRAQMREEAVKYWTKSMSVCTEPCPDPERCKRNKAIARVEAITRLVVLGEFSFDDFEAGLTDQQYAAAIDRCVAKLSAL